MSAEQRTYISDQTAPYLLVEEDADSAPQYYGYQRPDGAWYIQKVAASGGDNSYRYFVGSGSFSTNWSNRASLSFDYPNEVFI